EILCQLVKQSDVFITNMRPFEVIKYKIDYRTLNRLNKRLVYANLTGFGSEGPDKDKPAHDTVAFWARTGLLYMQQPDEGYPPSPGYRTLAAGDKMSAMFLACGIVLALFARERTGKGQLVENSLLHNGIYAMSNVAMALGPHEETFGKEGLISRKKRTEVSPLFIGYETGDNRFVQLSLVPVETYWERFCKAIGRPEMEKDPRFATLEARTENQDALREIIEAVIKTRTLAGWTDIFNAARLNWAPVMNPVEVSRDAQVRASGIFTTFEHPVFGPMEEIANPIRMNKTPAGIRQPGPEFGQHTEEVLLNLGYSWEQISELKIEKIIA
ncbi:MAG: CoA transferase, partial [Dehalococcoidales bacterium]|nr:CoA transferase [Dehalococcoidales bacterium]